jgi:hypothetical protein
VFGREFIAPADHRLWNVVVEGPYVLPSLASTLTDFTPFEIRYMLSGDPPLVRSARIDQRFMVCLSDVLEIRDAWARFRDAQLRARTVDGEKQSTARKPRAKT